jgi:hydroxycarboxylate dehydrogenase B
LFAQECQDFVQWLRQSPVRDGFDAIMLAGEPERQARQQRGLEGIHIDANTWQELRQAAGKLGVSIAE